MNNSLSRPNATVARRQASLNLVWGGSKQIDELPFKLFKKLRTRRSRAFPEDVYHRSQPGSGSDPIHKWEVVWGKLKALSPPTLHRRAGAAGDTDPRGAQPPLLRSKDEQPMSDHRV